MRPLRRKTRAQTATEYVAVISVIVIALAAAVYNPMRRALQQGSQDFKSNQTKASRDGYVGQGHKGERR